MKIFWAQTFSTRSLPGDLRVFRAFASLFQRKLENLEELENEADLVVNCCGLGAADLVSYFFLLPMVMTAITFSTSWSPNSTYKYKRHNRAICYISTIMILVKSRWMTKTWCQLLVMYSAWKLPGWAVFLLIAGLILLPSDFCPLLSLSSFDCERLFSTRDDSWAYLIPNRDSLVMSK